MIILTKAIDRAAINPRKYIVLHSFTQIKSQPRNDLDAEVWGRMRMTGPEIYLA